MTLRENGLPTKLGSALMHDLLLGVGFGCVSSAILALSAVALSLQYSVTNVPNFAHGELMTIGAYGAYVAQEQTHSILLAVVMAMGLGALLAFTMNRFILQPFMARRAKMLTLFVMTIVVSILVQSGLQLIFGGGDVTYPSTTGLAHSVGPFLLTTENEIVIVAAIVIMVALHVTLKYSTFGKAQRAVADNVSLARVSGVAALRIVQLTWLMAGAVAGLAGFVLADSTGTFTTSLGFSFLLPTFAAAVVGGIGKPYGAMLGAVVVGLAMEISAIYIPADYKESVAFALLIATLLVRPTGLFGTARGSLGQA